MKRLLLLATIILALLSFASSASAKTQLGLHLGLQKARGADNAATLLGVLLRSKMEKYAIEASIDYRQEKYFDGEVTVRTWPVMLTLLWYPIPFLHGDIGAGWYNTTMDYSEDLEILGANDDTSQRFGWHFGGGAEFPLESVTLTADVRYVFLDYKWNYVPGTESKRGDFYMLTFGLLFNAS